MTEQKQDQETPTSGAQDSPPEGQTPASATAPEPDRAWRHAGTERDLYPEVRAAAIKVLQEGAPFFLLAIDRETGDARTWMSYLSVTMCAGLLHQEAKRCERWLERAEGWDAQQDGREAMAEHVLTMQELIDQKAKARHRSRLGADERDEPYVPVILDGAL